jgi:L-fuconolactonase
MMIIDSQVHVWPSDTPERPLGPGHEERIPYSYQQLLADMDRAGVDRAVLVPPTIDRDRNDYVLDAARKHPDRFAVMGRLSLVNADRDCLRRWREQPGMLGVRLTFHRDVDRPWLTDGTADWFWPQAQFHDIPVMVHAPERLPEIGEIAERYPDLRIIVDHMGFARATVDEQTIPAAARMAALARHPNVFVKVSALPAFSTQPYPFKNLDAPIRTVLAAFGPRRAFWGGDLTRVPNASYRQIVTHFTEALDFLAPDEREWIMGRGLAECLRWPIK